MALVPRGHRREDQRPAGRKAANLESAFVERGLRVASAVLDPVDATFCNGFRFLSFSAED